MTPEFYEFMGKLGYKVEMVVSREEMEVTAFGDSIKRYVPIGFHHYQLTIHKGGMEFHFSGNSQSDVEAEAMKMVLS